MNTQIRDLIQKTLLKETARNINGKVSLEQFALLIIQECVNQCQSKQDADNIRKYFGIE